MKYLILVLIMVSAQGCSTLSNVMAGVGGGLQSASQAPRQNNNCVIQRDRTVRCY